MQLTKMVNWYGILLNYILLSSLIHFCPRTEPAINYKSVKNYYRRMTFIIFMEIFLELFDLENALGKKAPELELLFDSNHS